MTVVSLDARRTQQIGESEAAAACGVDPFTSRLMLWFEKCNGIEREDSEAMALGRALQPAVADILGDRGFDVMPAPADGFVHPTRSWQVVHPDGFAVIDGEPGLLEIKTRGTGWSDEDGLALGAYFMQLYHGMSVTGRNAGLLAILHGGHGGMRLETQIVYRDDEIINQMVVLEQELVECIRTETPPTRRRETSFKDAMGLMWPDASDRKMRLTGELYRDLRELRQREEQLKVVKEQRDELRERIMMAMGDACEAYSPTDQLVVTWRDTLSHRFDSVAFRAKHPRLYEQYNKAIPGRRFLLK